MRGLAPDHVNKLFLLQKVQTVPENNPAPYVMEKGPLLLGVKHQGVRKTNHLHPVHRLKLY